MFRVRLRADHEPLSAAPRRASGAVLLSLMADAPEASLAIVLRSESARDAGAVRRDGAAVLMTAFAQLIGAASGAVLRLVSAAPHRAGARAERSARAADGKATNRYRAEVRLRVSAPTPDVARAHAATIVAALRSIGGSGWRPVPIWSAARFDQAHTAGRPSGGATCSVGAWQLAELCAVGQAVSGLPAAPIELAAAHRSAGIGKVICLIDDGRRTPATLSTADARQHVHVLGPTGSGKSTLLLNLILDDIAAGRGVGVVDPKGDLVQAVLERIPASRWSAVTLVDPSRRDRPVGLNVLESGSADDRELVCDRLVTIFRKTYHDSWGPRTDDLLRAAVLTLLHREGATLCEVPLLLLQPDRQRDLIDGLADPVGLGPFWEEYRGRSEAERLQMIGPVLNKLRAVLLRPTIRDILGQTRSTVDLDQCLDQGGILLVSLAKGLLGEETSRLLGGFLIARLWQAAMARANRPESERPDFVLYLDEFQNYLHLPASLDEILAEARGYHLGLVLANQHLGQLSAAIRAALASNARTRVVFQCGQDDARILEREFAPWLDEADLRALARFQVAVRLCQDGRTSRPCTGLTRPEPIGLGRSHADAAVAAVLARVGRPRAEVERELVARLAPGRAVDDLSEAVGGSLGGSFLKK